MKFFFDFSCVGPARAAKSLATCLLVAALGCAETDEPEGAPAADAGTTFPAFDAGGPSFEAGTLPPVFDAGPARPTVDAAAPIYDATTPVVDATAARPDAATTADGGFMLPDLSDLFPTTDAGPRPTTDAGTGGRNVNGPCADLQLLCFDFVDMWINAECATCNAGKGCQGCAIPFAY